MAFDLPTIVAANNAGNDTDYDAWVKVQRLINAANAGQLSGFRNKLINGDFSVWQSSTSFTGVADQYTADRWKTRRLSADASVTFSRQPGFSGARYCMRMQRDAGDTDVGHLCLGQLVESADAIGVAGKTIVVTFDARAGANFSAASSQVLVRVFYGEGIDETAPLNGNYATAGASVGAGNPAITTTASRVTSIAVTIPATATEFYVMIYWLPSGTAGAADYIEVTNVQLEVVNSTDQKTTPFESRPNAIELAMCERFCQKSFLLTTAPAQNVGANTGEHVFPALQAGATAQRSPRVRFRQRMRATPQITLYNPAAANAQARDKTAAADCSATATSNVTEEGFEVTATGAAGGAIANPLGIHWLARAEL